MIMAREMFRGMIMGLLLAMLLVPKTMQLHIKRPQHLHNNKNNKNVERRIDQTYYRIGLILSSEADEKHLLESDYFEYDYKRYPIYKSGRVFRYGWLAEVPVLYVVDSSPACLGVSMHIMLGLWYIEGFIEYGNAATISDSVKLGDVAVISEAAFTSAWTWKEYGSKVDANKPSLTFGDYNEPKSGHNKLGSIEYNKVVQYKRHSMEETFWHPADPDYFEYAYELKDMDLGRHCVGEICTNASVVYGVKAASSDAYVQNFAYGQFLNTKLRASIIDTKSAATISIATSYRVNHVIFRAASSRPGEKEDPQVSALARENNLKVVIKFIEQLPYEDDDFQQRIRLKKY